MVQVYVYMSLLTWSPFPRQDLARHGVCQRNSGESKANEDLSSDKAINVAGAGCNGRTDERDHGEADEQGLACLERVRGGADDWTDDCLNEGEGIRDPGLLQGTIEICADV